MYGDTDVKLRKAKKKNLCNVTFIFASRRDTLHHPVMNDFSISAHPVVFYSLHIEKSPTMMIFSSLAVWSVSR